MLRELDVYKRQGQYRDRGVLHGPLCLVYGITGCLITIALRELSGEMCIRDRYCGIL